ncbi:MAG: DUF302 domain-containing protein [Gammaproteobacteria bacterium]|nr:DUF302 domain-containing protein [Gammaproteobacteria bacterium]
MISLSHFRYLLIVPAFMLAFHSSIVQADTLLMARTTQDFPEAMLKLQETIKNKGYVVSRVQRIDIGLTSSGYKTDKYRLVFFGKPQQIKELSDQYPHLIPYLPFNISIFAEGEETLLVMVSPTTLKENAYPELDKMLETLERDVKEIFAIMRQDN